MNFIKTYKKVLLLCAVAIGAATLTSCEDQPDKFEPTTGLPSVKYIRCLSSEVVGNNDPEDMHYTNGELVTSASPGSTVCLIGENLRSVYEVWFNDLQAPVNPSTLTDNTLIVSVPGKVPGEVTDKIYLKTRDEQTVEVDFKVVISAPTVRSMICEFSNPGAAETISGNYMIDDPNKPLKVEFTRADGSLVEAEITGIAADFTSVDIIVPDGAAEGPVYVTSVYGKTKAPFNYRDTRGMLFDFDSPNGISDIVLDMHAWNGHNSTTDETAISGNFWQFGAEGVTYAAADHDGWPDESYHSFAYWPGNWEDPETFKVYPRLYDLVNTADWQNMTLKFEMYVPTSNPWKDGALQIVFAGTDRTTNGGGGVDAYGNVIHVQDNAYLNDATCPRALYRPWTGGMFDTGDKWITVSLPLASNFIYAHDGTAAKASLTKDSFASVWMALYGGGVVGETCEPIIKIDNIRLVPNK